MSSAHLQQPAISLARSAELYRRARVVSPGGVHGDGRFYDPHPVYLRSGMGSHVTDVDGNEYVDFHCGFGAILLGHSEARWLADLTERIKTGTCLASANEAEVELSEKLVSAIPNIDMVAFCNTGSEATYHAIRLARAITGRRKLLKFEGNYHGWHDYVAWSTRFDASVGGPANDPVPVPASSGMSDSAADEVVTCGYNDIAHLEEVVEEHGAELAAVIVEPIFHNAGVVMPAEGFLEACRTVSTRCGALLIADEVITGVRHGLAGVAARRGIDADIMTMGKAVANGVPLAVVAGREGIMSHLRPTGDVLFAGTFNGNALSVAAGISCVDRLMTEPQIYDYLSALGRRLAGGLRDALGKAGVGARVQQYGSVWALYFADRPVLSARDLPDSGTTKSGPRESAYRRWMLQRGFYIHPHYFLRGYLNASHTEDEVDAFVEASADYFDQCSA
jgi:glutamate-1-semialdehyde 2,1-aminomutase